MKPHPAPGLSPDHQIDATMAAVMRKHGWESVERNTPLSELLAKEAGDDLLCVGESEITVWDAKREAMRAQLAWIFEKGPDPRVALRRLYALAHEVGPQLLRDLAHEEMALLLGDGAGRATSSARSQAIFGGIKSAIGMSTEFGGNHKGATARARMRASAIGNTNRRGKGLRALPAPRAKSQGQRAGEQIAAA